MDLGALTVYLKDNLCTILYFAFQTFSLFHWLCYCMKNTFEEKLINNIKVSKGAKIRNRYNQVLHLTQDTNGKQMAETS